MNLLPTLYKVFRKLNIEIHTQVSNKLPVELSEFERDSLLKALPFTMTPIERYSIIAASMRYLKDNQISGDVVECGVWAGGSIGAAALLGGVDNLARKYWLYDTFKGMTNPGVFDGDSASKTFSRSKHETGLGSTWCEVSQSIVEKNLRHMGVDLTKCIFISGDVSSTLTEGPLPEKIALLRLDTDWYESTKLELEVLFPRLVKGGILIIDDYGHWEGARKAVNEFFSNQIVKPLFVPLDYSGRMCLKIG
jgi:hypothetical protein